MQIKMRPVIKADPVTITNFERKSENPFLCLESSNHYYFTNINRSFEITCFDQERMASLLLSRLGLIKMKVWEGNLERLGKGVSLYGMT